MTLEESLQQGIDAAQAGHKETARLRLTEVVEADETQLEAWLWLSQVVDSLDEKAICLENVLTLDPENQYAAKELDRVKSCQAQLFAPTYAPGEESPPPAKATVPDTADIPVTTEYPYRDEFDDEWLCPYCTAPTRPQDRRCPTCRQMLVLKKRVKEERTVWLWRGIFLQIVIVFLLVSFGVASFTLILKVNGIQKPAPFLPLYFGWPVDQPEAMTQTVSNLFPLRLFWGWLGVVLYSLLWVLLLYFRVPYGHFLYLINSSLTLLLGFFGMFLYYDSTLGIVISVALLLVGAGQLLVTLNLWNDFTFKEGRLRFKIDRGIKNHQTLYVRAREYGQMDMWGMAALHLRRAVSRDDKNPAYLLALTVAYMNIKRYDLAEKALDDAEKVASSGEVWRMRQKLNSLQRPSRAG